MTGRYGDSTRSVKCVDSEPIAGQPVAAIPIPASTFHLSADESGEAHIYGRYSNPVWSQLEAAIASLEESTTAVSFGSGMAAVTAALRVLVRPGSVLVVPADGYHQVRRYAREILVPMGVTVREVTAPKLCDAASEADVVLVETPTNPELHVVDLHLLAGICRRRGATLVVDNTTATPLGQLPLSMGADLVVASASKALAGHSDLVAGYVAGSRADLMEAVQGERMLAGPILGAFEAWMLLRSIGSFGLRFDRQCQNALALATALRGHRALRSVRYPGLPDDPSHPVAVEQMRRFGGVVSIELESAAAVHALVKHSELLVAATSFGGLHTSVDRRARWGDSVPEGFARISVGIEDTDDLVADVVNALDAAGL